MSNVNMIYSEERKTWNVFVDNEWYFEGTYEEADRVYMNCICPENDEYYEDEPDMFDIWED